jgi:hypothetical protein
MLAAREKIVGPMLKALSGKSKVVEGRGNGMEGQRESRKRPPRHFRLLTNRVEGTLHPAGIRIGPAKGHFCDFGHILRKVL